MSVALVSLLLAWGPPDAVTPSDEVYVSAQGVPLEPVIEGAGLRMPSVAWTQTWDLSEEVSEEFGQQLFLHLKPSPDGGVRIEVVLADGRAFVRDVEASIDESRVIATDVVNFLASIRADQEIVVKTDVALPTSSESEDVQATVDAVEAIEPKPVEPKARVVKPERPPAGPLPELTPSPIAPREPGWELGISGSPFVALWLPPPDFSDVFGGGGFSVDVAGRFPNGLLVRGDLRYLGRIVELTQLHRFGVSVGVGYALRKGAFEMPVSAGLRVEGYTIADIGVNVATSDLNITPLVLGGVVRVSPGWHIKPAGTRSVVGARISPTIEFSGGFSFEDGAPSVIGIADGDVEVFRVGGPELTLGLAFTVWVDPRRRR